MPIHASAIVNPGAEIDPSVEIGPFCVIDAHVRIDAGCRLMQHVYVTGWTRLGADCIVHPGAIVGHEPQDKKYVGERSFCRIGRGVVLREYVTIHRGTEPESQTVVGDGCFLLAGAHVAHNCIVGSGVTLINNVLLAGHVQVGDRVTLGGGAKVHQFVRIGAMAMVMGNASVGMDVLPFGLVDADGRIAGINRVGLRRAGYSQEDTRRVRDAYRILLDGNRSFENRRAHLRELPHSEVGSLIQSFVDAPTKRGLAGRVRRRFDAAQTETP